MAATMGLGEFSTALMASCRLGDKGGLPNSVISAPAMKVRPSHARMPTLSSGSCASLVTPSMIASRTPTLMALTGGLLIQMMPTSPRFSNLPCMCYVSERRGEAYQSIRTPCTSAYQGRLCRASLSADSPAAVDQMYLAGGLRGNGPQVVNGFGHVFGRHQRAESRRRLITVQHGLEALGTQPVPQP